MRRFILYIETDSEYAAETLAQHARRIREELHDAKRNADVLLTEVEDDDSTTVSIEIPDSI